MALFESASQKQGPAITCFAIMKAAAARLKNTGLCVAQQLECSD